MSLQSTCYKIQEIQVHRILDFWEGIYVVAKYIWYKIQEIQVHRILDFWGRYICPLQSTWYKIREKEST